MDLVPSSLSRLRPFFCSREGAAPRSNRSTLKADADRLEACLPGIWQELRLPGTPYAQSPHPTRAEAKTTYERLNAVFNASALRRSSQSPTLDGWLRQAFSARACMQGAFAWGRLGDGPHFIAHPSPRHRLPEYMGALLEQRVPTVVALDSAPWWNGGARDFGSVRAVPCQNKTHTLGRPGATLKVKETAVSLQRGNERHVLHVLQIPWQDFGVPPVAALTQSIALANARTGCGVMAVHCGAGRGRTGTFISAAQVLRERAEASSRFGLLGQAVMALLWTRMQRPGAVETPNQFVASLEAALVHETHEPMEVI